MFPPKHVDTPQLWLNHLWMSLQRAAPVFTPDARVEEHDDERYTCTLHLLHPLTDTVKKALEVYARQYSRACGWPLSGVRVTRHAVVFKTSSIRASSSSKNR